MAPRRTRERLQHDRKTLRKVLSEYEAGAMAHLRAETFEPDVSTRQAYDALYAEYVRLHDLFGRGGDPALKTLKRLKLDVAEGATSG